MNSHIQKQILSAIYYLVFEFGMSIPRAKQTLIVAPKLIPVLSELGSEHWKKCEVALIRLIDRVS